jgi:hypothetical protein
MFADFRVHGLKKIFFQCFHYRSTPTYRKRKRRGFAHLVQPMYAKVREHGAPVQGERLGEEARNLSHYQRQIGHCGLGQSLDWEILLGILQLQVFLLRQLD